MPGGFFDWLAHDVEVKRQMVAVAVVAAIVTVLELVLFFFVITPAVVSNMRWLLNNPTPVMNKDPVARDALRAMLATAEAREADHLRRSNQGVYLNAALIVALPVLVVLMLYGMSPALRASRQRGIWIDVAVVSAGIGAFEGLFYLFGQRWAYPDASELVTLVAESYMDAAGHGAVNACHACATQLHTQVERSPTAQYIRQLFAYTDPGTLKGLAEDGAEPVRTGVSAAEQAAQRQREMLSNLRVGDVLAGLGLPVSVPRLSGTSA